MKIEKLLTYVVTVAAATLLCAWFITSVEFNEYFVFVFEIFQFEKKIVF